MVAEIPANTLADDAPEYHPESKRPDYLDQVQNYDLSQVPELEDYNKTLLELVSSPNLASKEWVYNQYDHMVRSNTVVRPGSDAAVVRVEGTERAIAISTDCNSRYIYLNPKRGTQIAVAEAARNIVCSGGRPLAITDGINFGNPEKPEVFYTFQEAISGMKEACLALNTPVTGGNVSFYNESIDKAIYPTPIIGMVGVLDNMEDAVTMSFKDEGDQIFLIGENKEELGGSEYLAVIHGLETGQIPELDLNFEKSVQQSVLTAIERGIVKSAHDCAEGGLAVALAKAGFENKLGAEVVVDDKMRDDALLFGETQSRIIVTVSEDDEEQLRKTCTENNVPVQKLGTVQKDQLAINDLINIDITKLKTGWEESIPCIMSQS